MHSTVDCMFFDWIGLYLCKLVIKSQNHSCFARNSIRIAIFGIRNALGYMGEISTDYINSTNHQGQCCTTIGAWHHWCLSTCFDVFWFGSSVVLVFRHENLLGFWMSFFRVCLSDSLVRCSKHGWNPNKTHGKILLKMDHFGVRNGGFSHHLRNKNPYPWRTFPWETWRCGFFEKSIVAFPDFRIWGGFWMGNMRIRFN